MSMPAGKYYIGDLCYVMSDAEWEEFCSITIDGHNVIDGEFQLKDGRRFATYGTAFGDGVYSDLKVVEIPDDINWYIEEYDGLEHVAERHRTWS